MRQHHRDNGEIIAPAFMDIRVKERLIGAILLVAIIVALVPELLTGPRDEAGTASTGDVSLRTYVVDLGKYQTQDADSAAEADTSASSNGQVTAHEPGPEKEQKPPKVTEPASPAAQSPAPATSAPTQKPQVGAAPQATSDTAAPDSGWAVQLGSFANQDNAERLVAELKERGFRAFVSRFESGRLVRYRVRVGPEQERSRAEALARRLSREGRQVSVVAHP